MPDVRVTNRNKFPLKGRFGGQDYVFPPGQSVTIPEKAAEHIFALAEERENKTGALNRLGLLSKPGDTLEQAYEALDRITLREGYTAFDDTPQPMPPPPRPRSRPRKAETPEPDDEDEPEEEDEEEPEEESEEIGDSPGAPRSPGGESEAEVVPSAADALVPTADDLVRDVLAARRKRAAEGG